MGAEAIHMLKLPLKHKPSDIKPQGHGSGLDADTVDGLHAAELGAGVPSDTVQPETTWGISPSPGTSSAYARGDHTHGTPPDPIPSHNVATGVHGVGSQYIAKTPRSDQLIDHDNLVNVTPDQHHPKLHKDSHTSGGEDAFTSTDILEAVVKRLQESSGPTILVLGAVSDGKYLKRSGTNIVGDVLLTEYGEVVF
jgi:hypothetical protein